MQEEKSIVKRDETQIEHQAKAEMTPAKPAPVAVNQPSPSSVTLHEFVKQAGTLKVNAEQAKILHAPIDDTEIEIRPDGLLYIPAALYIRKLNETFPFRWQAVPLMPNPQLQNGCVLWTHYLVIDGVYAATAVGQCEYRENNPTMTYGDAIEGAISNAIVRLCKRIGINMELWDKRFIEQWKAKFAESYKDPTHLDRKGKPKEFWRKKINPDEKPKDYHRKGVESAIKDFCTGNSPKPKAELPPLKIDTIKGTKTLTKLQIEKAKVRRFKDHDKWVKFLTDEYKKATSTDLTSEEGRDCIDKLLIFQQEEKEGN